MNEEEKNSAYYWRLSRQKLEAGEFEQAMDLLGEAAKLYPGYYEDRARYYTEVERYEDAIQDYTALLAERPDEEDAYAMRAFCYNQLDKFAEAAQDYTRAIELTSTPPNFSQALNYFGRAACFYQLGHHERADEGYSRAIELEPSYEYFRFQRAHFYEQIGEKEKSLEDFRFLIETLPSTHSYIALASDMIAKLESATGHE